MINILKNLILVTLIGTCFYLGTWQIERAQDKIAIQKDIESQVDTDYSDINQLTEQPIRYKKLFATGVFNEPFFLLDNIVFQRKAGYYVISPLFIKDRVLLVNRGWVDNHSRQKYPSIETPKSMITIKGYVKYPMQLLELSSKNITEKKPYVIQNINTHQISKILNKDIFPFILNLNQENQYAYTYIPIKNENSHLKHYMYAGQWFLFTIIGMFFLFILNRKKNG
jgi:cytochrome oxidase assembly protein ShyY1